MEVEEITDIRCPNCAKADEFLRENEEREDRTSDREGGGSSAGTVNSATLPSFPTPQSEESNGAQEDPPASSNLSCAKAVMNALLEELPECTKIEYDLDSVTKGFINFTRLRKKKKNTKLEKVYEEYHRLYRHEDKEFVSFFEKVERRSFSETIAKGIGSIMKIATG